ncbi:MAG TPA: hypothetical protein VFH44_09900 [Solirubrobacterales bacterium]|nr:hypothetical protein [Solirubrobacterales bacterium]
MAAGKPAERGAEPGAPDLDAMGTDKRRPVVGRSYGISARKRLLFYGIAVLLIVLAVVAFLTVFRSIDEREIPLEETAPWAAEDTPPVPPRDVDFMRNGPLNTIPADQITSNN